MTGSCDIVTPTALSGTNEVQLNGGNALQVADALNTLIEVIPVFEPVGAFTVDQSFFAHFRIASNDVSIEPCRFVLPAVSTGDASFESVASPALRAYTLNIGSVSAANINYYCGAFASNAVEPKVSAQVNYSTNTTSDLKVQQRYWQRPETSSTGGTTVDTKTTGSTLTITDAAQIISLNNVVAPTTAAASVHTVGEFEFQSSDFEVPFNYKMLIAPIYTGLGAAAASLSNPDSLAWINFPIGEGIPTASRCLINTFYTNRDAKGTGDNFIGFVSYIK